MAKKAKEKENLDFFYLGEEKEDAKRANAKRKSITPKNASQKRQPKRKKSKPKETKPNDFDNEIIIGLKRVEDKPKQKPNKSTTQKINNSANKRSNTAKKAEDKNIKTKNKPKKKASKKTSNKNLNNKRETVKINDEINISEKLYDDEQIKKYESPKEIEKKRKKRRRIFRIIKIFMVIFIILGGIAFLLLSPIFNINDISVAGNSKVSSDEIISLSGLKKDENIFKINKETIREKIKQNAYIDTVDIKRNYPDKVIISVTERTPTYQISFSNLYMLINNQGYMLETTEKKDDMPIITGISTSEEDIKTGNRLCVDDLEKIEDVLKISESAKTNNIYNLITQINISNKDDYIIVIESEKKTVYIGDTSNLALKMLYVSDIISKEKDEGEIFVNTDLENKGAIFRKKV